MSSPSRPSSSRRTSLFPLLATGLCLVLAAHMALQDARYLVPLVAIAGLLFVPALLARQRMRRLLLAGDPKRVLGTWQGAIERVVYPETMAPLMAATAYASYGWVEAARHALDRAAKGPAWDAALEQRLFVETLLDAFEGERAAALKKAEWLQQMPLPPGGPLARRRMTLLRRGLAALARAFAHASAPTDERLLVRAAQASPLIHWAMRYAAAIVAIDQGRSSEVKGLLADAPEWPAESAFRVYHDELLAHCCA